MEHERGYQHLRLGSIVNQFKVVFTPSYSIPQDHFIIIPSLRPALPDWRYEPYLQAGMANAYCEDGERWIMTSQRMMNGNWYLFPGKNHSFSEAALSISCTRTDVLDMEHHVFVNLFGITIVNIRLEKWM
jgi:hypothetical protein